MISTTASVVTSNAAADLLAGAISISENVYSLPLEDFIVTHGLTSTGGKRIVLESVNDPTRGAINLYHNVDPDLLQEMIPEDVYLAGSLNVLFKPSASAGSETCYNFQLYPTQVVAHKLLSMKGQTAQGMVFPNKKAQLNGDEASFATSINRGNKGRAAIEGSKVFKKEASFGAFMKGLLG